MRDTQEMQEVSLSFEVCNTSKTLLNTVVTESFIAGAFGSGTGPIWMSGLSCAGSEVSLFDCSSTIQLGWVQNTTTCTHSNDVAVRCQGLPSGIKVSRILFRT